MRHARPTLLVTLSVLCVATSSAPDAAGQEATLLIGGRFPDNKDYRTMIGTQPELAVQISLERRGWPVGLCSYAAGSYGERDAVVIAPPFGDWMSGRFRMATLETGVGVRKSTRIGRARPFIAGGLAWAQVQTRESTDGWHGPVEKSHGAGTWLGAGVSWPLGRRLRLGVAGRYSWLPTSRDFYALPHGGGAHVGFTLGRSEEKN